MIRLDIDGVFAHASEKDISDRTAAAVDALSSLLRREGPGSEMLGWLDLPLMPEKEAGEITETGEMIRGENDCLVVVGIGGSYLGARAAIEALPFEAGFPVLFAGNSLSPVYHERLISALDGKKFAVCVISKSGTTTEPAIAFRLLRDKLYKTFGARGRNGFLR